MSNNSIEITSTGILAAFLLNPHEMTNFEFGELTEILVDMWFDCRNVLRKHLIDFVIITACNQRSPKGLTRQQYIEISYVLVPMKIKKASKAAIQRHPNIDGLFHYI